MTVRLSLTRDDEERIERQLSSGRYADAEEVVRQGLQLLEETNHDLEQWLDKDIAARAVDADTNPDRLRPADDVFASLAARHGRRRSGTGEA